MVGFDRSYSFLFTSLLSIALGSTLGGLMYDGFGYTHAFALSALLLLVAAALTGLTSLSDHHRAV